MNRQGGYKFITALVGVLLRSMAASAQPPKFAYVVSSNTISAYAINPSTGVLTPIGSMGTVSGARSVRVDPSGRFVYVLGSSEVASYKINQITGALTEVGIRPGLGGQPRSVIVDPSGRFLYTTFDSSFYHPRF